MDDAVPCTAGAPRADCLRRHAAEGDRGRGPVTVSLAHDDAHAHFGTNAYVYAPHTPWPKVSGPVEITLDPGPGESDETVLCVKALVSEIKVFCLTLADVARNHYHPAVAVRPGVEMRVPILPGWWARPAKYFRVGAELQRCGYTLEGWDQAGGLLYVESCDERQQRWRYAPASDTHIASDPVEHLSKVSVAPPTDRVEAVIPGDPGLDLTIRTPVFRSPDGRWDAFVACHVYGPEDVVLVATSD